MIFFLVSIVYFLTDFLLVSSVFLPISESTVVIL
jgi:hypothetical protein